MSTGKILHYFPEGATTWSMTTLDDRIYVLRSSDTMSNQIEVYKVDTYEFVGRINVPNLRGPQDITSCRRNKCLYVSDDLNDFVHKIDLKTEVVTKWDACAARGLSVTDDTTLVATCSAERKIIEFSLDGKKLREFYLQKDATNPRHAIKLANGNYVVCHGWYDLLHRVMLVDKNGRMLESYGGEPTECIAQLCVPSHLAVSRAGDIHLVDRHNKRILLMTPDLQCIRHIVHQCDWYPIAISLDEDRGRLLIAESNNEAYSVGRVIAIEHNCHVDDVSTEPPAHKSCGAGRKC